MEGQSIKSLQRAEIYRTGLASMCGNKFPSLYREKMRPMNGCGAAEGNSAGINLLRFEDVILPDCGISTQRLHLDLCRITVSKLSYLSQPDPFPIQKNQTPPEVFDLKYGVTNLIS